MNHSAKSHPFQARRAAVLSCAAAALGLLGCKSDSASKASPAPATASVQEAPAKAAPQTAPAPREGSYALVDGPHAKLAGLVGTWKGDGSLSAGGNQMPVSSVLACEVVKGGIAVSCTHEAKIEGMGELIEHALIGLDPASGTLHWFNINTMGETHDHVGRWAGDTSIDWSFEEDKEGKALVESIRMDFPGDSVAFRSETTLGGEQQSLFEGTLRK